MHNTQIIIDVQAPNNTEILTCVRETFEFMPGWIFAHNISNCPTDARFFAFDLTYHTFNWWRTNTTFSDTMDEDEMPIKDLADISNLLEFVWVNGENLRTKYIAPDYNPPPKKKRKKTEEEEVEDLSEAFQKFFNAPKKPTAEEIVQIQPMNLPSGKVFYKDFAPKETDISEALFEDFSKQIQKCNTASGLNGILNGLLGLHGPLATKLGHFIDQKIKNLNYPPKTSWQSWGAKEEAWYANKQQKLHEKMATDVASEIDKEVLAKIMVEYEKYAKEAQAQKTQMWYDQVAKSKVWSKGWDYTPYPSGKMVKTSMPYSYSDVYPTDSMDY
jgi:hypothetical protein